MLNNILASYMQLPDKQTKILMELLCFEKRWQEKQQWKDVEYDFSTIKTQADFISFIQAVGQTQWFKGHDRSKFADNISNQEINDKYFSIFKEVGLTDAVSYDVEVGNPVFSVILGSSESNVLSRIDAFKKDVVNHLSPSKNIVFGLGCNRVLGVSVLESEKNSKDRLLEQGKDATEMNMVNLLTEDAIDELKKITNKLELLSYQQINTTSIAKTREDNNCVKTGDTATSLKQAIEDQYDILQMEKPINIAVYSCQPFVLRQQRDVHQKLGSDYNAIGVGHAISKSDFDKHPKSINVFLGELARLVNINYTPENLKKFNVALTADEIKEVKNLFQKNLLTNTAIKPVVASSSLFANKHKDTYCGFKPGFLIK